MSLTLEFIIYESILVFTCGISIFRWRILGLADRWISILLCLTVFQECITGVLRTLYINNYFTYHIYTPIEVFFIINFFTRATGLRRAKILGSSLGGIAVLLSILNTIFLQGPSQINSYYLLLEGIIVICLCLYSFYRILILEDVTPKKMAVFWITCSFLFYWCLTFVNFGIYPIIAKSSIQFSSILNQSLFYANVLFYVSFAIIFLYYKKLVPSGE